MTFSREEQIRNVGIFIGAIVFVAAFLYFSGFLVKEDRVIIAGCESRWNMIPVIIESDMCPNGTGECFAQPYISKHNAFVEAMMCACKKALDLSGNVQDSAAAKEIEDRYKIWTNFSVIRPAQEICSGQELAKWTYG